MRLWYDVRNMRIAPFVRLAKVMYLALLVLTVWGVYNLMNSPFDASSFWGVGMASAFLLLLSIAYLAQIFGISRALMTVGTGLGVVFGALCLNAYRGWPFGPLVYGDILGPHLAKVAWPMPVFWTAIFLLVLLVMRPKNPTPQPKSVFTWSFDTAIVSMFFSLLVEPILSATGVVMWSVQGPFLGISMTAFLGWFITILVAAFSCIWIGKLWITSMNDYKPAGLALALFLVSFLLFVVSVKIGTTLVTIISAIGFLVFLTMSINLYKRRREI